MNDIQFKKVTHTREVLGVLDANEAITNKYPVIVEVTNRYRAYLKSVEALMDSNGDTGGITSDKAKVKNSMALLGTQLAGSAFAYAVKQNDVQLQHVFTLSDSELKYMRDEEALTRTKAIANQLDEIIEPLGEYLVEEADVENLRKLAERFAELIGKRGSVRASGKTNTKSIATAINQLFAVMEDELDKLMKNLARKEPQFANEYFSVRDKNIYTTPEREDDDAPDEPQTEQ